MNKMSPKVDGFLRKNAQWREESKALRAIALDCPLSEDVKWGKPCYIFEESNIVLIQGFKDYCALMFFKGALLKDAKRILHKIGEHTQAGRQIRFTRLDEIVAMKAVVKAYIEEAIAAEKAGLKVKMKEHSEFEVPEEFQEQLDKLPALKKAFHALTPGRQRGYLFYFSGAKQSATGTARVEKHKQRILDGKGIDD